MQETCLSCLESAHLDPAVKETNTPLHARLRDTLQATILGGKLRPGDRLPSEAELALAHGVSRITVRNALGALQNAGLIVRQQGRGAFVAEPDRAQQSLNRLQGLGEALVARGQRVHNKRLQMRRRRVPALVARQLAMATDAEVYQMTMLRYVDREPLSVNHSFYPLALGERLARQDLTVRDLIDVLEHDLGQAVARADLEIRAAPMPAREAAWLGVAAGVPAMQVQRVLFAPDEQPIQTETVTYRAEAFSYRLSLRR
jgi:GntR family transcriptional regulator